MLIPTIVVSLLSSISIVLACVFQFYKISKVNSPNDIKAISTVFWLLLTIATVYNFAHLIDINASVFIIIAKGIGAVVALSLLVKIILIKFTKATYFLVPVIILSMILYGVTFIIHTPSYIQIISIVYVLIAYLYQMYKISSLKTSAGISSKAFLSITLSNILIVVTLVINNVESFSIISQCISTIMAFSLYKLCLIYQPKKYYKNKHNITSDE